MTPEESPDGFIISREEFAELTRLYSSRINSKNVGRIPTIFNSVRSHPYNPQADKKNYFGGECTCNKFVNCHDCRDAFSYKEQDVKELGVLRNILALKNMKKNYGKARGSR